jgi:dolichyl-phosphate beta-glucosyltransferase
LNAAEPEAVVEAFFEDGSGDPNRRQPFPSLITMEKGDISLSIIVPAYKEEKRLPKMLDETIQYLSIRERRNASFTWEIIVVDDGSPDNTYKVALQYTAKEGPNKIRVLKLAKNHGKGGAIKKGMLRARGKLLLMADADGATRISDVERLEEAIQRYHDGQGLVFGSRSHMIEDDEKRRTGVRGFVSRVFHEVIVSILVPGHVRDTQCGFKLFSRGAARSIFPLQKFYGWAFDCELLFLARVKYSYPVSEVAVEWRDVEGSKLIVTDASLEMVRDITLMNIVYRLGIW